MKALLISDDAFAFIGDLFQRAQESGLIGVHELGLAAHTWESLNNVTTVDPEAMKAKMQDRTPAEAPEAKAEAKPAAPKGSKAKG